MPITRRRLLATTIPVVTAIAISGPPGLPARAAPQRNYPRYLGPSSIGPAADGTLVAVGVDEAGNLSPWRHLTKKQFEELDAIGPAATITGVAGVETFAGQTVVVALDANGAAVLFRSSDLSTWTADSSLGESAPTFVPQGVASDGATLCIVGLSRQPGEMRTGWASVVSQDGVNFTSEPVPLANARHITLSSLANDAGRFMTTAYYDNRSLSLVREIGGGWSVTPVESEQITNYTIASSEGVVRIGTDRASRRTSIRNAGGAYREVANIDIARAAAQYEPNRIVVLRQLRAPVVVKPRKD